MSLTFRAATGVVTNLLYRAGVDAPPSVSFDGDRGGYTSVSIHPDEHDDIESLLAVLPECIREHFNRDDGEFVTYTAIKDGIEIVIFQPVRSGGS